MKDILETWERRPYVEALVAFRGFQTVAAMTAVSELGDLGRFAHPRQLMGYLGLVPGEDSSGARRRQGSITKTGNGHARWMLIECASHYSHPPRVSPQLSARQEGQSREVRAIAWRAQNYPAARDLRNGFAPGLPQGGMAVAKPQVPPAGRPPPAPQQGRRRRRPRAVRLPLGAPPPGRLRDRRQSRGIDNGKPATPTPSKTI